jgi:hypothetical protein
MRRRKVLSYLRVARLLQLHGRLSPAHQPPQGHPPPRRIVVSMGFELMIHPDGTLARLVAECLDTAAP